MKNRTIFSLIGKLAFAISLGLLASACAVGNQYDYKNQAIEFNADTDQKVGVAVVDQRAYVLSGEKTPNFVGLQRGGFGNPFDVTTKSNEPLADSISFAIVEGLKKKNVNASVLIAEPTADLNEVKASIASSGMSRFLMVYLTEWKTDTFVNSKLVYDVKATVANSEQSVLAENSLVGSRKLLGETSDPFDNVPIGYRKLIKDLVNDPKLLNALK